MISASTEGNVVMYNHFGRVGAVGYLPPIAKAVTPYKCVIMLSLLCCSRRIHTHRLIKIDEVTEQPVMVNGKYVLCKPHETGEMLGKIVRADPARQFQGYTDEKASQKKVGMPCACITDIDDDNIHMTDPDRCAAPW